MANIYVARSRELGQWGADVGLTKHLYKLGLAEDGAEAAVRALNDDGHAGARDWKLVKKEAAESASEEALLERLAQKERMVDPALYPRIKGARGIFKVKLANVENHMLVERALAGQETRAVKVTPAAVGAYLIHLATH